MLQRNKLVISALVALFVLTGFFREFVFLNWNEQMRVTYYNSPDSHVHVTMQWLSAFSYTTLYWLKWPMTLAFSILFAGLSMLIIHAVFRNKQYNRITVYAYASLFTLSFLFAVSGWLFGLGYAAYPIARFLTGMIESPALLVILIASFLLHRKL